MEARTLREAFDEVDRVPRGLGQPAGLSAEHCLSLATTWRVVIDMLKATPFDRLPAAIWQMDRDLEEIIAEGSRRFASEHGGIAGAVTELLQREQAGRPGGDGDSLDIRPPGGARS